MIPNSDFQSALQNQFETAASLAGKPTANAGKIVNEVQDMTTSAMQARVAFLRKLATARDASEVVKIQAEHSQAAFAAALKRSKEFYELLAELTRDTVQSITIAAEQTKAPVNRRPVEKRLQAAE